MEQDMTELQKSNAMSFMKSAQIFSKSSEDAFDQEFRQSGVDVGSQLLSKQYQVKCGGFRNTGGLAANSLNKENFGSFRNAAEEERNRSRQNEQQAIFNDQMNARQRLKKGFMEQSLLMDQDLEGKRRDSFYSASSSQVQGQALPDLHPFLTKSNLQKYK